MIRLMRRLSTLTLLLGLCLIGSPSHASDDKSQSKDAPQKQPQVTIVAAGGAAGQATITTRYGGVGNSATLENVDASDQTERVLLLLSKAPLLIELSMLIDGRPFRASTEAKIDRLAKVIDTDKDGKPTWEEALASPQFLSGRFAYLARNAQMKQNTIKQNDVDKDGLVDRVELRRLFARMNGGAAFYVQPSYQSNGQGSNSVIRKLLDTDKDGDLSAAEIAASSARLKMRDADDNDLLELTELGGQAYRGYRAVRTGQRSVPNSLVLAVSEGANWESVEKILTREYGQEESLLVEHLAQAGTLAKKLDKNSDGKLDAAELKQLALAEPHLKLEVQLGDKGDQPAGLKVTHVDKILTGVEPLASDGSKPVKIQFVGTNLLMHVSTAKPRYNAENSTRSMFNRYDKDKNGYLEKKELGAQAQAFTQQFNAWDSNSDGKVFKDEMTASYRAMQEPMWNRIAVGAASPRDPLFQALDTSGDSRLGLREMRRAAELLSSLDKDGDGKLTSVELPESIRFGIARAPHIGQILSSGQVRQMYVVRTQGGRATVPPAGTTWFERMDRNGDGDLSKREFLGTDEQFQQLDQDNDGLIDAKEAKRKLAE